jgi:leucyl-tRNA synthetase
VVNGSVLMEGKKMSKSFGNIIPLREAVREFGVDPLRLSLVATAGLLQDVDFSPSLAKSMRERLERLYTWTHTILNKDEPSSGQVGEWGLAEKWLWSRVNRVVKDATAAMDELRFRDAVQQILYTLDQDIHKYTRLTISKGKERQLDHRLLTNVVDLRIKLFTPFTPFICEELWKLREGEGFVSQTMWPNYDAEALDEGVEEAVRFLDQLVDDIKDVTKILKGEPVKVRLYAASPLKVDAYQQLLNGASMGEVMTHIKGKGVNGSVVGILAKSVKRWSVDVGRMPKTMQHQRNTFLTSYDEITILKDAVAYLEQEIQLPIEIYGEDEPQKVDPEGRAGRAEPLKPAIHVETK